MRQNCRNKEELKEIGKLSASEIRESRNKEELKGITLE